MIFLKRGGLILIAFVVILLTGCNNGAVVNKVEQVIAPVEDIDIPDGVKIIGFGEATHGNSDLQKLKKEIFETLTKNENVYTFVLEADFGGAQQINQYILNGLGTAKEAVDALDYDIYRTEEMIELIQWMHDYNLRVTENKKLYFYGNDMQRYDFSKQGLLDYYKVVNEDKASSYSTQLNYVSNDTMRELSVEQLKDIDVIIDNIISDLQFNKKTYIEWSSQNDYEFALQFARILKQRTQLFLNEEEYTHLRDQYLTDNLQWIMKYEASFGRNKVFISAHNGHIEKTSASLAGYKSMGNYLDELYGDKYFAIGTDLIKSEFRAKKGDSNKRAIFRIQNNNQLVKAFNEITSNIFYVDFEKAQELDELAKILKSNQNMVNIGDGFSSWYKLLKQFYTIKMIPQKAYDGIIIVKEAGPTTIID